MSTETLLKQLEEYQIIPYRKLVMKILKQQQQTIREQKELIESLWAEGKDEESEQEEKKIDHTLQSDKKWTYQENKQGSPGIYDDLVLNVSVYTKIM